MKDEICVCGEVLVNGVCPAQVCDGCPIGKTEQAIEIVERVRDDFVAGELTGDGYYKSDERQDCADALDHVLKTLADYRELEKADSVNLRFGDTEIVKGIKVSGWIVWQKDKKPTIHNSLLAAFNSIKEQNK